MSGMRRVLVIGALLAGLPAASEAAGSTRAANVLFEARHLDHLAKGSEVRYRFERKVSNEKLLGAGFTDEIKLGVIKVNAKNEREVVFQAFTGSQARESTSWPNLTINPIFIWYLDRAVGNLATLAGASPTYLKARLRSALADKAEIEEIAFKYGGKDVAAYRVTVRPFADDPNSLRMEGFERSRFTVVISEEVPGYFIDLVANFDSSAAAAPSLEEHISLVGMGEVK